jgi:hypothetical protein
MDIDDCRAGRGSERSRWRSARPSTGCRGTIVGCRIWPTGRWACSVAAPTAGGLFIDGAIWCRMCGRCYERQAMKRSPVHVRLDKATARTSAGCRRVRWTLLLALCGGMAQFATGCATCAGSRNASERIEKSYLPPTGMRAEALLEWLGPPDLADHRDGQDIYTWSYIKPTLDHPVLMWSPVVGYFFTSVTVREYSLSVTCRDNTVIAANTSQTQAQAGF